MKFFRLAPVLALSVFTMGFIQDVPETLDVRGLRQMCEGLGHTVKDINTEAGKEKWSVTFTKGGLDIPVGVEISPSKNYIWLTVNLGDLPQKTEFANRAPNLLSQNASIQPSFFYVTSSKRLMLAMAVDNRKVSAPILRRCLDKLTADVEKTKADWQL